MHAEKVIFIIASRAKHRRGYPKSFAKLCSICLATSPLCIDQEIDDLHGQIQVLNKIMPLSR